MKSTYDSCILEQVQKPGRYIGGEPGQVIKDPEKVDIRFALCFPDAYEIGMSHLGLRILYSQLNSDARTWCERAFAPLHDMEAALRSASHPLTSLESGTPLCEFDVLGFSLQHELCMTNVLLMLDLGGVPLRASQREGTHPLVIAGGPTACHPESVAPFFDAVALGDGEEIALQIAATWVDTLRGGATREQSLAAINSIPEVYVPSLAEVQEDAASRRLVVNGGSHAKAARVRDIDAYPFPTDGPVAITEAVFDRAMVEIARGCSGGCRFCQAGMVYRPVRERDPGAILHCLLQQISNGGYDEASLTSLSTADYSQIGELLLRVASSLSQQRVAISVSSLRAHGLDEHLTEALATVRTTSLTLAPEAATQRLREVINKNISDDDIIRGAQTSMVHSRRRLKLYFMIGLPTETDEDIRAIANLAGRIQKAIAGKSKRPIALTVAASTFIPKPHTPLQWCRACEPEEIMHKQTLLRSLLKPLRVEARFHDIRLSMLEAIIARADRRVADLIEAAYLKGARFDGWDEYFDEEAWNGAMSEWTQDPTALRAELPLDARLPWDHLEIGPSSSYLRREHRRALAAKPTSPCLRLGPEGEVTCHHCGLECDLDAEKLSLEARRQSAASMGAHSDPPKTSQESMRYRLTLEKRGDLIWIGHLDTVRLVTRLMRRAGLTLTYSQGFHPKPKMSFAAPLPLGMAGLAEVVDVALSEPSATGDPSTMLEALQRLTPPGLNITSVRQLQPTEPAATKSLAGAELLVVAPSFPEDIETRIEALLESKQLEVSRPKRKVIDLRPALLHLELCRDHELLKASGTKGEPLRGVFARVALGRGPSIRREDLIAWLGCEPSESRAYRLGLLTDPMPTELV